MYTSGGRDYSGLDDFFGTSSANAHTGLQAIKERIKEIDSVYKKWEFNIWNFTHDHDESQFLINEVRESTEIMRSSSYNYIIGEYNSAIMASSSAVERVCNVILYLEFIKNGVPCVYKKVDPKWRVVNTASGPIYYDQKWNLLVKMSGGLALYNSKTLSGNTLKEIEVCGYSCNYLLNPSDSVDKNIFIDRRNAAAHGVFTRIPILEQEHGYIPNDINDLLKLMTNKDASLDQYTKASNFIVNVINEFNKKYTHV